MVAELFGSFVDNGKRAALGTTHRLMVKRQGVLMSALTQERRARAEARQRLSWALGEVGGRAEAVFPNQWELQSCNGLHRDKASGETGLVRRSGLAELEVHREDVYSSGSSENSCVSGEV